MVKILEDSISGIRQEGGQLFGEQKSRAVPRIIIFQS